MASSPHPSLDNPDRNVYLPDFCSGQMVLAIVLIAELVAIVLALSQYSDRHNFWLTLARSSLFLLWAGLGCSASLCAARRRMPGMSDRAATALALLLIVATTLGVSVVALLLGQHFSGQMPGSPLLPRDNVGFLLRNGSISLIAGALVLRYFYVTHQWRRNVELEARSRISALQARIRPHFLFNSLNTIASLTRSDPHRAEQAVEDLADLFRTSLSDASHKVRLKEELETARMYQRIEQLRLGERLHVHWDVDALPLRALVPSLCVQPLLENAIYHGIEQIPGGGTVTVIGRDHGHAFEIEVRNPLPPASDARRRQGNRIALENIRHRLALAYEKPAKVTNVVDSDCYRVTLWIPRIDAER